MTLWDRNVILPHKMSSGQWTEQNESDLSDIKEIYTVNACEYKTQQHHNITYITTCIHKLTPNCAF